ncbi:hypothetical protein XELAEV_18040249mg [Xenopus laevis]|uniref:Uncharacterized protein n=1 Tax=Xenopus laevis TaxID=8355 RepID=A0A974H953_XENLA|nr:hypothetical protein XELAEV_18040249mg [Xenopus laevis]
MVVWALVRNLYWYKKGSLNERLTAEDYDDNADPEMDDIPLMSDDGNLPQNLQSDYGYDDAEIQSPVAQNTANGLHHPPSISVNCDYDDTDLGD